MKFALCNEMFGTMPEAEGLALAASLGYTGVEVAPFTLGPLATDVSPTQRRAYRQLASDHGLEVVGLHWLLAKTQGFHLTTDDREVRHRTAAYLRELARLCRDIGGSLMVLGSPLQRNFIPPMTHAQAMRNAKATLCDVLPALEEFEVRIAIEPLGPAEGNFLNHAWQARALIDEIASPWVRLHLDVKAMSSEGIPIDQIIRDHRDAMIHFHANDPNRLGPGMGALDQRPVFRALAEIGYSGWVSVEVFDYTPGVGPILEQSMANMRTALGAG